MAQQTIPVGSEWRNRCDGTIVVVEDTVVNRVTFSDVSKIDYEMVSMDRSWFIMDYERTATPCYDPQILIQ